MSGLDKSRQGCGADGGGLAQNCAPSDSENAARECGFGAGSARQSSGALPKRIGFPSGFLVDGPLRVDVAAAQFGKFAVVDKPADVLFDSYLGAPKRTSMMLAMRGQSGKGEFARLGIESPYAVNQIDYEYSGASIMAANKDIATAMRNAMWSGFFTFKFLVLTRAYRKDSTRFDVELPVLMHEERPVWIVSHRFGKKAKTSFELVRSAGDYQLWQATANTVRPHQIRLHAAEAGLDVVGEWIYSKTPYIFLSKLKGEYKLAKDAQERALYPHLAVHLSGVEFDGASFGEPSIGKVSATVALPKGFEVQLRKLEKLS